MMCNGVFTSNRTLDQVFEQELAYVRGRPGTVEGDDFVVDSAKRAVAVGLADDLPAMRAAYRDGLGCVIMPPDQTFDHIPDLPILKTPPLVADAAGIPWPVGDGLQELPLPPEVDAEALDAAAEWAFDRATYGTKEQVTLSLIVVYRGQIVLERYAPGVDYLTKTRTWSTAKSIAVTLIGMLVDEGKLSLDEPLGIDWLPRARSPETDPRSTITLRHVLNMSSGLYPVDNGLEYATGWWLVPDDRTDVPADAYATAGNRGQYVMVVPSHELVIVRRGLDFGRQGFNRWDLTREVIKAIAQD